MTVKPQQIFEYLLAVQNLTRPPVRDIHKSEEASYLEDLPQGEGCFLFGEGEIQEAWLEVHKQQIPPVPKTDPLFHDWLSTDPEEAHTPPVVMSQYTTSGSDQDETSSQKEKFEDSPERVEAFKEWLTKWNTWSEEAQHKQAVQNLYNQLFSLINRLEREGEILELVFGHGLLLWNHPVAGLIRHPVLTTRMELQFDTRKGRFTLIPSQQKTVMETEMLSGVELPQETHLPRLRNWVNETRIDPLNTEETIPFYKEMVQTLHPEGQVITEKRKAGKTPVILDKPVWFLRKRATQMWKEELRTTIESLEQGMEIPKTIQSLLQMEPIQPEEREQQSWSDVGKDLYFPLPANEDQKEIARRLSRNFGVTVQGPPGTGKSHTIANLISHLLAHGKKVLVTSHKEPALRVLADKIPEQIRSLCVSVLGRDSRSLQEIEDSVRSISNQMAALSPDRLYEEIQSEKKHLKETRNKIACYQLQLKQLATQNMEPIQWKDQSFTPMEAAIKLTETEGDHGWIPDPIKTVPPLDDSEMRTLWSLVGELPPNTPSLLQRVFPAPESLPNVASFQALLTEGEKCKEMVQSSHHLLQRYSLTDSETERRKWKELLTSILKDEDWQQSPFLQQILEDVLAGGQREQTWTHLIQYVDEALSMITELHSQLAEYDIDLPEAPRHQLQQDIQILIERLQSGKSIQGLYSLLFGRKIRYLIKYPTVDGHPIRTLEEAQRIEKHLNLQEKRDRLVKKWNTLLEEVEGPVLDVLESRLVAQTDAYLNQLRHVFHLKKEIQMLQNKTTFLSLPNDFQWHSPDSLKELREAIDATEWNLLYQQWKRETNKQIHFLKEQASQPKSHPVCSKLVAAYQQKSIAAWDAAYEELTQIHDYREKNRQLRHLTTALSQAAPTWTSQILNHMGQPSPFPDQWQEAWEWKRVQTEVERINALQPEKIEEKLQEEQQQERRHLAAIVSRSAWREQLLRITEPQQRALVAWKQKIKKIGKGTGKYAEKHRQEARQEMEQCQSAIPVWIMPIHRVIENLSLHNDKFDVVIVDESSQCDLFALSALLRAERAVIVGDDEQISPSAVGINQETVRSLISRYLDAIPQANSLDMQTSLYDVAMRIFPGKLMLREHFRCVPEIIQFSNDLSYGGDIIPLRLPTRTDQLEPSVLTRRVPGYRDELNRINEPEADCIVEDIQAMLEDPKYAHRTIGVISLLGNEQAQFIENRLRETIGEEKMIERKIICGDAYAFQGDERDIICLSMVVAPNVRFQPLIRKEFQQRFNVAASRAKNQMRLYHSVDLDELHPDDFRYRLLNYCLNPHRVTEKIKDAEALCESQFERDVLRMIIARGYHVRPQVQVGRYRIDLVVEGLKNRLAVECDGDRWHGPDRWEDDRIRQQTLERAGWTFWRIRGSSFYRNRNQSMESLWAKLAEMGIEREVEESFV
ncbi:DUF559 domain-containing protein [Kroppenstedtia pulmonis]|uniref:DUF559 domain-containing protein n=1 Tax=Kroppenstedtia pulmonis TaxID=1380685 RepID=A0A7D3XQX1_9BACL|nr:AAA domain-containing protein [Kroppenstedtia pulmonis]QKG84622.1 DUF559 domain-containing protein [Kroppenstedtia pulmonis]